MQDLPLLRGLREHLGGAAALHRAAVAGGVNSGTLLSALAAQQGLRPLGEPLQPRPPSVALERAASSTPVQAAAGRRGSPAPGGPARSKGGRGGGSDGGGGGGMRPASALRPSSAAASVAMHEALPLAEGIAAAAQEAASRAALAQPPLLPPQDQPPPATPGMLPPLPPLAALAVGTPVEHGGAGRKRSFEELMQSFQLGGHAQAALGGALTPARLPLPPSQRSGGAVRVLPRDATPRKQQPGAQKQQAKQQPRPPVQTVAEARRLMRAQQAEAALRAAQLAEQRPLAAGLQAGGAAAATIRLQASEGSGLHWRCYFLQAPVASTVGAVAQAVVSGRGCSLQLAAC